MCYNAYRKGNMIERTEYLDKLKSLREKKVIKIATGIRRCGKSTLYSQFVDYLKQDGVDEAQITHFRLTDGEHDFITTHSDLFAFVKKRLVPGKMNYIFLDEVQEVKEFQKAVNSLFELPNTDVYITGSNSKLLSSEFATYLTGRYVEIKMLPLSFKEYLSVKGNTDILRKYNDYITTTSFPAGMDFDTPSDIRFYLEGIYSSIVLKDVVARHHISDVASLNRVVKFLYDNIGNPNSSKSIANALNESNKSISAPTVDSYIEALKSAYVVYEAQRYDIKGKEYLKAPTKYYIPDIGLRFYLLGSKPSDTGRILENVVFLELYRRGYEIAIGKVNNHEVDFIATDENREPIYIQVAEDARDPETLKRELASLQEINDNYPKVLLSLDETPYASYGGIKKLKVLDWLVGNVSF